MRSGIALEAGFKVQSPGAVEEGKGEYICQEVKVMAVMESDLSK